MALILTLGLDDLLRPQQTGSRQSIEANASKRRKAGGGALRNTGLSPLLSNLRRLASERDPSKLLTVITDGASLVAVFFLIALIITAILLYFYCRCWRLTLCGLLCSVVGVPLIRPEPAAMLSPLGRPVAE